MIENFLYSCYYDSSSNNDKFIIIYNLHIAIIQTMITLFIGVFKFNWSDYVFNVSITRIFLWIIICVVINIRWLLDWTLGYRIDRTATEKEFGFRFITVSIAQVAVWLFGIRQSNSWVEWICYIVMCVAAFYFYIFRVESELKIVDIETNRPSTISMNVRYNSIYVPGNN